MPDRKMQRMVIIGATGSGKTTLGRRVGEKLHLPMVDLDELHWLPGWKVRMPDEFHDLVEKGAAEEKWIICGNYSVVRDAVWPKADAIVWLDYPFMLVFRRLIWRTLRRIHDRKEVCNGNVETWSQVFSKDSIIAWLFRSYWRRREAYQKVFRDPGLYPNARYIRLKSPAEAEVWFNSLKIDTVQETQPASAEDKELIPTKASA